MSTGGRCWNPHTLLRAGESTATVEDRQTGPPMVTHRVSKELSKYTPSDAPRKMKMCLQKHRDKSQHYSYKEKKEPLRQMWKPQDKNPAGVCTASVIRNHPTFNIEELSKGHAKRLLWKHHA